MKKTPVLILVGMALILLICCASAGFADEGSINQVNSEPLDMEILSPEGNYVSSTGKIPISLQSAGGSIVTVKIYPMDSEYLSMGSFRLDVRDMVVEYHAAVLPAVQMMMMDERVEEPVTDEIGEEIAAENTTETIELPSLPSKMFSETIGQTGRWLYELTLQPGRYILLIQAEGNMMRSEEYALSVTVTSMERATEFLEKLEEAESSYITPAVLAPIQWPLSMY